MSPEGQRHSEVDVDRETLMRATEAKSRSRVSGDSMPGTEFPREDAAEPTDARIDETTENLEGVDDQSAAIIDVLKNRRAELKKIFDEEEENQKLGLKYTRSDAELQDLRDEEHDTKVQLRDYAFREKMFVFQKEIIQNLKDNADEITREQAEGMKAHLAKGTQRVIGETLKLLFDQMELVDRKIRAYAEKHDIRIALRRQQSFEAEVMDAARAAGKASAAEDGDRPTLPILTEAHRLGMESLRDQLQEAERHVQKLEGMWLRLMEKIEARERMDDEGEDDEETA